MDPDIPANFGNLKILRFYPASCSNDNLNNHSIVTVLEYANIKVKIPGDNENCSYD